MKKRLLLIAVAGAIVVGCADEMLDTSYESVLKEAQLKGDHPLIFNAYVGDGMANTRATVASGDLIENAASMNGDNLYNAALSKAAGVFAYYHFGNNWDINTGEAMWNSTLTSDYTTFDYPTNLSFKPMTKILDNEQIRASENKYSVYLLGANGDEFNEATVYWPTPRSGTSEYVTFFAYYPHVNPQNSSYNDSNLKLIDGGDGGFPALDYQVATHDNLFQSLDLMAAVPVVDKNINEDSNTSDPVELNFKHLLAAVSVKIKYSGSTPSPELLFTKAEIQGAKQDGVVQSMKLCSGSVAYSPSPLVNGY
ncbi:MAG: fimbrillin family protein [Bacteroidaceae bacterium]|nr:fimbrillin family protein [Bacteroidaceae bacterium]